LKIVALDIPLEFHRRGVEDGHYERFVEAIYDFFFVLGYLFGEGNPATAGLMNIFSQHLTFFAWVHTPQIEN
jgi:hypothetical protein